MPDSVNSFDARATLTVGDSSFDYFRIDAGRRDPSGCRSASRSCSRTCLRTEDGSVVTAEQIRAVAGWDPAAEPDTEIQFSPSRVVMQDFTGVPAVVDLATMREAMRDLGGDPSKINPLSPAELVIDHSVIADLFGAPDSFARNVELEYERNGERYQFLRWGQKAFNEFAVVPPGTGIVHQVNIEYLARVVFEARRRSSIRTRWSAPTPTRPWSTAWACSAGASAASRPRRPCSASRSACSSPAWSASSSPANCPRAPRPPTWC